MKIELNLAKAIGLGFLAAGLVLPATVDAQTRAEMQNRQKQKNQWRNLGYAGAALGALGLVEHNGTLATAGVAGGLYSAYRYEQDRKSQKSMERRRAEVFSRSTYVHNGHRYTRHTKWVKGKKYYYFTR